MMIILNGSSLSLRPLYVLILLSAYAQTAFVFSSGVGVSDVKCIESERQALLTFKKGLEYDSGLLSSWGSEEDCCKWSDVYCSNKTGHIIMLNLGNIPDSALKGNISSSLFVSLQHLKILDLSGNDFDGNHIPESIASLNKLRFLDLSFANFKGRIPHQFGNLTNLRSLQIGGDGLYVKNLGWLSHLHQLKHLSLESLDLRGASDWLQVISGLPSLKDLSLSSSSLPTTNYPSDSSLNSSTSLAYLDLSFCGVSNSAYNWLNNISSSLLGLGLLGNKLRGPIWDYAFWNMTSLVHLDLYGNEITAVSKSFRNLCSLKTLYLDGNNLNGQLPELFLNLSGCTKKALKSLILDYNMLTGSLPDITEFSSLRELSVRSNKLDGSFPYRFRQLSALVRLHLEDNQLWGSLPDLSVFPLLTVLDVSDNRLNGTVSEGLGQLSKLEELYLFSNSLEGIMTEAHMLNLSKLKYMDFSDNSLVLNFSTSWFPTFQLEYVSLRSCKLGPHFPKWLRGQKNYYWLDVSNSSISDIVPTWFGDLTPNLIYLNLSYNSMKGLVPNLKFGGILQIDLSSNCFEGPIPRIRPFVKSLILSKNTFSGSTSILCSIISEHFYYLDLSDNQFSGEIPDCSGQWQQIAIINLANNNFTGEIPNSTYSNCMLRSLHLRNNSLTGELPSSLKNCSGLTVIDLGNNKFSGVIPTWLGYSLPQLIVVSLRFNHFYGCVPTEFCNLQSVHVLDFSHNNISGTIPKCLNKLSAMAQKESTHTSIAYMLGLEDFDPITLQYVDHALLVWKRQDSEYKNILGLLKSIDLSTNRLSGEIPDEITSLAGLLSLNLSTNGLIGPIPAEIGQLTSLNSLDLSNNRLSGKIPESLSNLSSLGVLDLSNNNLSGKIPLCTQLQSFDASTYMGNPLLCGIPLPNKCSEEEPAQDPVNYVHDGEDELITRGYYISLFLGYFIGFCGVCGTLMLNRPWRYVYFCFLNNVKDKLYVLIAVNLTHLQRLLSNR